MSTNSAAAEGFESLSSPAGKSNIAGKSLIRRIFDKMAANAERQAMARIAAADPRFAAELRAARDRAEASLRV